LHDLTSPFQHPADGSSYEIIAPPLWTKPMGKQICIVDIDTRPMNGSDEVWSEDGGFHWQHAGKLTPGIMNHFLYATIHGYDYRYIRTTPFEDRWAPWTKPAALASLLKDSEYRFVVSIDADVLFPHLTLPYEWLLNHWNITEDIAVAMALDIDTTPAVDSYGRDRVNAGFVTLQNHPLTDQLLHEWAECPDRGAAGLQLPDSDGKMVQNLFLGCEKLKNVWPAEQGAFNSYIRYLYPDSVRELPCDEGMGSPGFPLDCKGKLVQHYTLNKDQVHEGSQDALAAGFMQSLQTHMTDRKQELVHERLTNDFG
jgi:hypothetical protein